MNERLDLIEISEYFHGNERQHICKIALNGTEESVKETIAESEAKMDGRNR